MLITRTQVHAKLARLNAAAEALLNDSRFSEPRDQMLIRDAHDIERRKQFKAYLADVLVDDDEVPAEDAPDLLTRINDLEGYVYGVRAKGLIGLAERIKALEERLLHRPMEERYQRVGDTA